jgi:hypothetical protein
MITRTRVIICLVLLFLLALVGFFWPSSGVEGIVDGKFPMLLPAEDPEAVPVVEAKELLEEFEKDSVATLKKYRGRIWIRGLITEISGPTVTLDGPPGINCVYVSISDQNVMRIRAGMGEPIVIEGRLSEHEKGRLHLFRPWKKHL